jgi:hypothetical protein
MSILMARDLGRLQGSTFCTLNTGNSFIFARLKKKGYSLTVPGFKLYYELLVEDKTL